MTKLLIDTDIGADDALAILSGYFRRRPDKKHLSLHDPLAISAILQPELLTFRQATVDVEVSDRNLLGKTTPTYGRGNVSIALGVHQKDARDLIQGLLED